MQAFNSGAKPHLTLLSCLLHRDIETNVSVTFVSSFNILTSFAYYYFIYLAHHIMKCHKIKTESV